MAQISVGLMSLPADWEEARRHAEWAEEFGFESLWTGDHLRHPLDPQHGFLEGWTLLAAWAAVTRRVSIGMLVSNLIYRHPALLARQAAAVDVIADGRLILGVGTGVYASDHAMAGVPMWSPAERVDRLQEFIAVLDPLLRGEIVTAPGPYYPVTDAVVRPRPVQRPRPPLLVGALGSKTTTIAVRHADVWNTWGGRHIEEAQAIEAIREQCQRVDTICRREGRDRESLRKSVCLYPPFDPWASFDALERLVTTLSPLGITEFIAYAPTPDKEYLMRSALASVGG